MTPCPSVVFTRAWTASLCCLALFSSRASAQTPAPAAAAPTGDTLTLPTFTVSTSQDKGYRATNSVSATRVDTPIKDLPFAITAFTEQFITDVGARELTDIVNFAPGVTSGAKEFTQGNNRYSIRGFDGDVTPQRNGFIGNRYVDAGNITRVEVVKGPASLLYGQITPGGSVNYITKRPQDQSFTSIKQQVGSDNFLRTDLDVNFAESADSRFKARLVGAHENGFEWTDPGQSKSTLIAPSVSFTVSENSTLILDYERFRRDESPLVGMMPNLAVNVGATAANFPNVADRARAQAYVDVGNLNLGFRAQPPLPYDFNYVGNTDYRKSEFDSFNLEYAINLGRNWTARVNYAWNDFYIGNKLTGLAEFTVTPAAAYLATKNRFDYVAEVVANPSILSDPNKTASAILTRRKRIEESAGNSDTFQAELTGKVELGNVTVKPLFGAYLSQSESFARRRESTTAPAASVANVNTTNTQHFQPWNYNDPTTWDRTPLYDEFSLPWGNLREGTGEESAIYGVLNASFFDDRLIAIGGARYNKTESTGINFLPTVAATPSAAIRDPDYSATKTTPQFGLGYKVRRDLLLFASYSESFFIEERVLTLFNPAYNATLPTNAATNPLTISAPALPTTGSGYEFGFKTDFMDGRVSSTVSFFHLERENRVLRFRETAVDGTFPTITRQGTVDESEGVEMELTWSPLDNWQVYATATFMDIKTTKATFPSIPTNADPIYQAAYVAAYNEAVGLVLNAVPEGSAETLGSLWTRYSFTNGGARGLWVAGGFVYTGEKAQRTANPTLFYDAHTVFDAVVGYDWKWAGHDLGATLSWKNVTDEQYFPANQARGLPSRFVLSLSAKF